MAKRIAGSKINWGAMLERVPENQKPQFLAFKSRSDNYLRRVLAHPESAPKIDWAAYKKKIPAAALVDGLQKSYESLKIPYPTENVSSQVDAQEKEITSELQKLAQETATNVASYKEKIKHVESLIPYSQMTIEEFCQAHPEQAFDTTNKPTYWPHDPEEQIGYVPKDAPPENAH